MLAAEVEPCRGPEVEEDDGSDTPVETEDDPTTIPPSLPAGGGGVMGLKTDGPPELAHSVTVIESPNDGHAGEWKIRDSHPGCEEVQLTITMSGDPLNISACTPDPAAETHCCDGLAGWTFGFFRKLKRKTPDSGGEDPVEPDEPEPV
jgi:hypothetical protein